ncbi:hypothetical protein [Streptomyces sp. NPDC004682]
MTAENTSRAPRKVAAKKTVPNAKAKAAEAEAIEDSAPVTFEFKGVSYELPHPLDVPLDILETDDELEATRLVLGDDQWEKFRETRPTIRDFYELTEAMSRARGRDGDEGN